MARFSHTEVALFLIPLLIVPTAIFTQKWKVAHTPKPIPVPTATPTPAPNLYSNNDARAEAILPSPDGKLIHTGAQLQKVKFHTWNAQSGALIRSFGVFRYSNADAVLSPNGKILGFGHGGWKGDRIVLFDSATGKEKLQILKPKATGWGFDINNGVVALPTNDDIRLYSTKTGSYVFKLRHRVRDFFPKRPRFSRDGKKILWIGFSDHNFESYANGNSQDEIVWFDLASKKRLGAIEFSQTDLFDACFSGDGKVILATGFRRYWVKSRVNKNTVEADVRFFAVDAQSGKLIYTRSVKTWANNISVSPDGKWFAFPIKEGVDSVNSQAKYSLGVYEVRSGQEKSRIDGMFSNTGAWSPDSKTLYIENGLTWRLVLQNNGNWQLNKGKN